MQIKKFWVPKWLKNYQFKIAFVTNFKLELPSRTPPIPKCALQSTSESSSHSFFHHQFSTFFYVSIFSSPWSCTQSANTNIFQVSFFPLFHFVSHFLLKSFNQREFLSAQNIFFSISYTHTSIWELPPVDCSGMSFKIWNERHMNEQKEKEEWETMKHKKEMKTFYSFIQLKIVLWNKIHEPKSRGKEGRKKK